MVVVVVVVVVIVLAAVVGVVRMGRFATDWMLNHAISTDSARPLLLLRSEYSVKGRILLLSPCLVVTCMLSSTCMVRCTTSSCVLLVL